MRPKYCPVRVDFAGGWLDVPRFARPDGYIINCTVTPGMEYPYQHGGGVGGSAAASILRGENPFHTELDAGVGWQDPAILLETGLCVWQSGPRPRLLLKVDPAILIGRMALRWSGRRHETAPIAELPRDYSAIAAASTIACKAVRVYSFGTLCEAVLAQYAQQRAEGMAPFLTGNAMANKYCGAGHGGYELHMFWKSDERDAFVAENEMALAIEPYMREVDEKAYLCPPMTRHLAGPMVVK